MPAAADRMPCEAKAEQDQSDDQHDNPDSPQDCDLEQEPCDQQDNAEDDHTRLIGSADHLHRWPVPARAGPLPAKASTLHATGTGKIEMPVRLPVMAAQAHQLQPHV